MKSEKHVGSYVESVIDLIGDTPLISLKKSTGYNIFAKAEFLNPGGSIKDRIALGMLRDAEEKGLLKKGMTSGDVKTLQELLYDVSVKADRESAAALSKDTIETLEKSGIDSEIAMRAGVAMEEITLNLAANEQKKKRDMDVRIVRNDEHVIISLRDNGTPFNPMEYSVDEEDYQTYGIMMFKAVTTDIQYSLVLSLNQTIIEI